MGRAVSSCYPQECILLTTDPELKMGLVIAHPRSTVSPSDSSSPPSPLSLAISSLRYPPLRHLPLRCPPRSWRAPAGSAAVCIHMPSHDTAPRSCGVRRSVQRDTHQPRPCGIHRCGIRRVSGVLLRSPPHCARAQCATTSPGHHVSRRSLGPSLPSLEP